MSKTRRPGPNRDRQGATTAPTLAVERRTQGRQAIVILTLVLLSGLWIALSMTVFFVGPAEWDDNQYCDVAAVPRSSTWVSNRYVHIWTLRFFYLLMESRQIAAGLYSALVVVGLIWVAYFLGRRMSGPAGGLVAALLMPLYPVLLKYMTVPYCDEPMILWSGVALVCALLAGETESSRARWMAIAASGLFCFMSVKCKETGLAVVPPVLLLLWRGEGKAKVLAQWVGGILFGWVCLIFLDLIFMGDMWFSCRYSSYFPKRTPNPNPTIRAGMEYLELLTSRSFLGFSLLGAAGGLLSFRENRVVRTVAVWAFGVLVFQSLISVRYGGIQALDRYAVGVGAPLIVLAAHWIIQVWQRPRSEDRRKSVTLAVVIAVLVGLTAYGLHAHCSGDPDPKSKAWRLYFFLVPLTTVTLFAIPWLAAGRWLSRAAVVALAVMSGVLSVSGTLRYVERSEAKLKPWVQLAAELDRTGATLAHWKFPKSPRIVWRTRALSAAPPQRIQMRPVSSLDEIETDERLLTDAEWWRKPSDEQQAMLAAGWRPFVSGSDGRRTFVVCRRTAGAARN